MGSAVWESQTVPADEGIGHLLNMQVHNLCGWEGLEINRRFPLVNGSGHPR